MADTADAATKKAAAARFATFYRLGARLASEGSLVRVGDYQNQLRGQSPIGGEGLVQVRVTVALALNSVLGSEPGVEFTDARRRGAADLFTRAAIALESIR